MDTACDMEKPIGYWVQQTRGSGETIAVKVLFSPSEQADAHERQPSNEGPAEPP